VLKCEDRRVPEALVFDTLIILKIGVVFGFALTKFGKMDVSCGGLAIVQRSLHAQRLAVRA
jgi:hypothetical protein